ncbi:MAG: U32 family peptidase [Defluviitaleaceae bacterium]|nr:U32 family peptidase [Defluviitaleaceae bacterium]
MGNIHIPALLSPAGSVGALYAAVNGGCDAVYLGGELFSARMAADNFADEDISSAIDYCHLHGVKIYVTVNTLYKNTELEPLFKFLEFAYSRGADAFIFQDLGAATLASETFPDIEIHASTQMNTHSLACARFIKEAGFSRLILSRELNLKQIENITKNSGVETEIFAHGALCVGFSGQCLLSSFAGGRSGNRGRCAQPCRLKYKLCDSRGKKMADGYLLSPKDMTILDNLKEIAVSGVSALKIEGRMKTPGYVYTVTSTYRKYLDIINNGSVDINENDVEKLLQAFNRGGSFSDGYIKNYSALNMMSIETPKNSGVLIGIVTGYEPKFKRVFIKTDKELVPGDGVEIWTQKEPHVGFGVNVHAAAGETAAFMAHGDISEGDRVYRTFDKKFTDDLKNVGIREYPDVKKIDIAVSVSAKIDAPIKIKIECSRVSVEIQGDIVQSAQNAPLTSDRLFAQISKLDTYPFNINFTDCDVDDNIYMAISAVNEVRRNAFARFSEELLSSYRRPEVISSVSYNHNEKDIISEKKLSISAITKDQLYGCLIEGVNRVYADISNISLDDINSLIKKMHEYGIELYLSLPRIDVEDSLSSIVSIVENTAVDGYLIRTYGQLHLLENSNKAKVLDSNFNVLNGFSADYLRKFANCITPSQELNLEEINALGGEKTEVIVYGRQVLMATRQCPVGLYVADKKNGQFCEMKENADGYILKDDKGSEFPIITDCDKCLAMVLNSSMLFLIDKANSLNKLSAESLRLDFTTETAEETKKIIECYIKVLNGNTDDKEVLEIIDQYVNLELVNVGHFYKGII